MENMHIASAAHLSGKALPTAEALAKTFDHTFLKAFGGEREIAKLCAESEEYGFYSVMVNPCHVKFCRERLLGTEIKVGCVVGFPLGATTVDQKLYEADTAIADGADEIDYVLNIGALKDGNDELILGELRDMTELCHEAGKVVKVIFENCYLEKEEIVRAAQLAAQIKPDFIKTSTGFGTGGATTEDVRLMRAHTAKEVKVKAAGGIRTLQTCLDMLDAGAERIGISAGVEVLAELRAFTSPRS